MRNIVRYDWLSVFTFLFCVFGGVVSHLLIFFRLPARDFRLYHSLSLGLSYDLMNAAVIATLAMFAGFFLPSKPKRILHLVTVFVCLYFVVVDSFYEQHFGTHLPFSSFEYLLLPFSMNVSLLSVLLSKGFLLIFLLPILVYFTFIFKLSKKSPSSLLGSLFTLIFLVVYGAMMGAYPNSYMEKNLNDPLISSGLVYFYWTRHFEEEKTVEIPRQAIEILKQRLKGQEIPTEEDEGLLLKRFNKADSCEDPDKQNELGQVLCGIKRPNILVLLLKSFRAEEIGVFGSDFELTKNFDRLSQEGVLFRNFFANGYQMGQGLLSTYCSVIPNYGVPILKRYANNHFLCLPELLRNKGYKTSWFYGTDAAMDNLIKFLPRNGFDRVDDRFAFDSNAEKLGRGFSDKELYDHWIKFLDGEKQPFFSSALTLSNQHPFEVPRQYRIFDSSDEIHRYYESFYYTDAMLGEFIEKIKKKSWYQNSLIFVLADSSNTLPGKKPTVGFDQLVRLRSHIPLLILGGLVKKPLVIDSYFSQLDLAPTIMDLLAQEYAAPWIGGSMIQKRVDNYVFVSRTGNYWGMMSRDGLYFRELDEKDHFFGFQNKNLKKQYKDIGQSWIMLNQWLLQENRYWK
ncbi:MAG: LTA synthase family protein [Deltaproteobacteria bacterium]|nr:LTA synthase family protein [Deltaproteobacteria bacterium]